VVRGRPDVLVENVDPRLVRRAEILVGAAVEDRGTLLPDRVGELSRQAGLADPRGALDEHETGPRGLCARPRVGQQREFVASAHEGRSRGLP
jgi:hypothetical protein